MNKIIVGSEEWCSLPELGIPAIKARVDSGAKTSALHAVNIVPFQKGGNPWVKYEVHHYKMMEELPFSVSPPSLVNEE